MLGPLLFLVYINDITENLETNPLLYADDTSLFDIVESPKITSVKLNNDLSKISDWANAGFNVKKTESITFSVKRSKPHHPDLFFDNKKISEVLQHAHASRNKIDHKSFMEGPYC